MLHPTSSLADNIDEQSRALVIPFATNDQTHRESNNTRLNNLSVQNHSPQNSASTSNIKRSPSDSNILSQIDLRENNVKNITNENHNAITSLPLFDSTINSTNGFNAGSFYSKTPLIIMDPLELQQAISHDQNCLIQYQQYQQQMQQQSFPLMEHYHNQTQLYGVIPSEDDELAAAAATWNNNFAAMHWMAAATYNNTNNSTNSINLSLSADQNGIQQNQLLQNSTNQITVSRSLLARYSGRLQDNNAISFNSDRPSAEISVPSIIPLNLASSSNDVEVNSTSDSTKPNVDNVSYRNL